MSINDQILAAQIANVDQTQASFHDPLGPLDTMDGAQQYKTVAAAQTAQILGTSGATGDYLKRLLVIPATTSPGNILLLDGAISITLFVGGASSVADLKPFWIPWGYVSLTGAWKITTGANVSLVAGGIFT